MDEFISTGRWIRSGIARCVSFLCICSQLFLRVRIRASLAKDLPRDKDQKEMGLRATRPGL